MLRKASLEDVLAIMKKCGLTTDGIETVGKAAKLLVERGAIEVVN